MRHSTDQYVPMCDRYRLFGPGPLAGRGIDAPSLAILPRVGGRPAHLDQEAPGVIPTQEVEGVDVVVTRKLLPRISYGKLDHSLRCRSENPERLCEATVLDYDVGTGRRWVYASNAETVSSEEFLAVDEQGPLMLVIDVMEREWQDQHSFHSEVGAKLVKCSCVYLHVPRALLNADGSPSDGPQNAPQSVDADKPQDHPRPLASALRLRFFHVTPSHMSAGTAGAWLALTMFPGRSAPVNPPRNWGALAFWGRGR
jgi:hypothetical protein